MYYVNAISQRGLKLLLNGKSEHVAKEATAWFRSVRASRLASRSMRLDDAREAYPAADRLDA
jgi:hypothetical protein